MSQQRCLSRQYVSAWSALSREAQAVLLALILLADDSGVGAAEPTLIHYQSPQLASTMDVCDVAAAMDELLESWPPYGEYTANGRRYYYLADGEVSKWLPSNHRTASQLPPPPDALVAEKRAAVASMTAPPTRGRPRGSTSAKSSPPTKASSKRKAAPAPAEKWTDPEYPESTYQGFQSIFNEVLGPHVGHAGYITRNAHRNIDLSIRKGYKEDDFRRACEIGAKLDWFCRRTPGKTTPTNLETTCAPKTIEGLLNGRYGAA